MKIRIVSGGQTGVDQGGLEAAVALGLEFGGWAPYGWLAERWPKVGGGPENGTVPSQYRATMREYPDQGNRAQNYRERTKANIRDSHATLILVEGLPLSGGTLLTRDTAVTLMKPHCVIDLNSPTARADAFAWLRSFGQTPDPFVLNVAGPRESKSPGIQARTAGFLRDVLCGIADSERNA